MKNQDTREPGNEGTESRDQETERMGQLLRAALPPIGDTLGPRFDLWPVMLRKFNQRPAPVPWFDWALIGGLAVLLGLFPTWIPVLLYYL